MRPMRVFLLAGFLLAPGRAADRDFEAIVKSLESHLQVRRTRIPLFGLARFVVRVARPEGVKQLDLAVFEDLNTPPEEAAFDALVHQAAGGRWQPLVRVRSRRDGEFTCIYSRSSGHDLHLLVAAFEPSEATIVRLKVGEQALLDLLEDPAGMGKHLGGDCQAPCPKRWSPCLLLRLE